MCKPQIYQQLIFADFDQFVGLKKITSENRWIKKAVGMPWVELEKKYAKKSLIKRQCWYPLRMALGALLIQENSWVKNSHFKKLILFKIKKTEPLDNN